MLLRIDHHGELPLFAQVAASVRADVAAGMIGPGDRLPAARDVAKALGINIHTVLRAYADLRDEGIVDLRRGRGAVVTEGAAGLASLRDDIRALVVKSRAAGVLASTLVALVEESARDR